jgi:hypothetical protein
MTTRPIALIAVLALVAAAGCSDKYENHTRREIELFEQLNAALAGVQSESDVNAAVVQLEILSEKFKAWSEENKVIGSPPEERKREIRLEYGDELKRQKARFGQNVSRIQKIAGSEKVLKAIPGDIDVE